MVLRMHAGLATERSQVWIHYELSTFVKWLFTQLNKCYNISKHTFSQGPPLKAAGQAKKIGSHYIFSIQYKLGGLKIYHVDCGPLSSILFELIFTGHNSWFAETKKEHSNVVMGSEIFFLWLNLSITFTDTLTQMISFESSWDQRLSIKVL